MHFVLIYCMLSLRITFLKNVESTASERKSMLEQENSVLCIQRDCS